jgi:1-acyl-sn-glycerol-3-phosphate acyltransferase
MRNASPAAAAFALFMWALIALVTVVLSVLTVLVAWVARGDRQCRAAHVVAGWWGQSIFLLMPTWRLRVKGRERINPRRRYILVSNHQSMFDIMAVYGLRRQFKWMAKDDLFRVPFLGWAMRACRYIALVRGLRESIRQSTQEARQWLRDGMSVLIFPEGTRSGSGQMLPFKNGAFKMAIDLGIPIVPVAIDGTWKLLARGAWQLATRATVRVSVLPSVDPTRYGREEFERLREDVRGMIQAELHLLQRRASSD